MTKNVTDTPAPIEREEVKKLFRSFQEEWKTGKELQEAMTSKMVEFFLEGRMVSDNARRLLKTLKAYGEERHSADGSEKVDDVVDGKETKETLEELEARLFKKENFTLSDEWKQRLDAEGFKEKKHYYIKNGNFYCKNKKLMEFILWGREAAKKRTIDRYNWAILKLEDTKSSQLPYTCTDKELTKAFKESKARKEWIKDPTVKQKFDNVNNPVGLVDSHGNLGNTDRSYLPLWSPESGRVFIIDSSADRWELSWSNDNCSAFPLSFSAKNS